MFVFLLVPCNFEKTRESTTAEATRMELSMLTSTSASISSNRHTILKPPKSTSVSLTTTRITMTTSEVYDKGMLQILLNSLHRPENSRRSMLNNPTIFYKDSNTFIEKSKRNIQIETVFLFEDFDFFRLFSNFLDKYLK